MATLPVLPLTDQVLLPGMVIPVTLDAGTQAAVDAARTSAEKTLLAVPRLDGEYGPVGTVATIEQVGRLPSGEPRGRGPGRCNRARLGAGVSGAGAALWVEATTVDDTPTTDRARELAARPTRQLVMSVLQRRNAWQVIDSRAADDRPGAASPTPPATRRTSIWTAEAASCSATPDVDERLERLIDWARDRPGRARGVRPKIATTSARAWRRASASSCCASSSPRSARSSARASPTAPTTTGPASSSRRRAGEVREAALREVGKLERASDQSPETGWIRTWLDTVLELPWAHRTEDSTDMAAARAVLDADHHGLDDVKDRIVEYLAVRARRAERGLQLVGGRGSGAVLAARRPAGCRQDRARRVGRAGARPQLRPGAARWRPGRGRDPWSPADLRRARCPAGSCGRSARPGSMNPVVLLDEVDKLSAGGRPGDPAAALLEVLDPAQNHTFRDDYLEIDLDLSDVLFLATANVANIIPDPLLDRRRW